MNTTISHDDVRLLLAAQGMPCVSLYQPTIGSFPQRQQNPIRFRNLLRQLERRVAEETPNADELIDDLMEFPLQHGGDVVMVPAGRVPTSSGVAAIYRF